jgi:hypothetical protein
MGTDRGTKADKRNPDEVVIPLLLRGCGRTKPCALANENPVRNPGENTGDNSGKHGE